MRLNASTVVSGKGRRRSLRIFPNALTCISLLLILSGISPGAEIDCLSCHAELTKERVLHPAVAMGCVVCHSAIDAGRIPHRIRNGLPKGLSSAQPGLCFSCHDKAGFTGKTVHPALGMGCTICHNPHSSKNAKLLSLEQPELCYTCHKKADFNGTFMHVPVVIGMCTECHAAHQSENDMLLLKQPPELCYKCHEAAEFNRENVHAPVAGGMCLSCHAPHASKNEILLRKEPAEVCLDCHSEVGEKSHVVSGGHPIGIGGKNRKLDDPLRTGKRFYCGSCHYPHSSDAEKLFRYNVKSSFELCLKCHNK